MKNIHVLSTDKPSRLFVDIDDNKLKITQPLSGEYMMNQNIYITSDEEIKDDWCYDEYNKVVFKNTGAGTPGASKKIILTTDIDLIKDSVQVIDDEFLEWFVKNPNCEEVEIKTRYLHSYKTGETFISFSKTPEFSSRNMQCIKIEPRYEIIIPQEEPKRKIDTCYNFDMEIGCVQDICRCEQEEPKQLNCCTPAGQIKRYVDCKGCDRKPKQITIEHLVKFNEILGKLNTTSSQDILINSNTQAKEKQTAVEWLVEKLILDELIDVKNGHEFLHLQDKAKEMEKEQIMEAFDECGNWQDKYSDSEHYYNKTYKKDK
jgi:hypothetical protein